VRGLRAGTETMSIGSAWQSRARRRTALKLGLAMALAVLPVPDAMVASADEPELRAADWKAIRQIIAEQRAALVAGDKNRAFGYATPALRAQFGDADTFMAMVQVGYAALLTARYTEFLDGAVVDGLVVQPLRLIDADNTVRLALYTLERQPNGAWRISGCRVGASTVRAA
jgi:Domain of unknown function (DUF4864)